MKTLGGGGVEGGEQSCFECVKLEMSMRHLIEVVRKLFGGETGTGGVDGALLACVWARSPGSENR